MHSLLVSSKASIEESLLVDPSIRFVDFIKIKILIFLLWRFFGAEWRSLTERWLNTVKSIRLILEGFETKYKDKEKY